MKLLVGMNHDLLRYGLIQLIKDVHTVTSMVEVASDDELLHTLKKYTFDLIVVHEALPGKGGFTSLFSSFANQPEPCRKVIMFKEPDCELNEQLKQKKINGLCHEQSSLNELMVFFQQIMNGEQSVLHFEGIHNGRPADSRTDLSKREEEIFNMKVRGYSVRDTARLLNISPKTVENHRRNIKKKLSIRKNHEWFEWGKRFGAI